MVSLFVISAFKERAPTSATGASVMVTMHENGRCVRGLHDVEEPQTFPMLCYSAGCDINARETR